MDAGLRKRRVPEAPPPASIPFAETIRKLDVYPKTLDDFKERTGSGAAVSLVSCTFIVMLIFSELRAYLTTTTHDQLYVDTAFSERIRINVNVTFPNMPCSGISLVAMDVAGEQQIDVVSNMVKTRYAIDGTRIGIELDDEHVRQQFGDGCGPCFAQVEGMEESRSVCCNSCKDVQSVYASHKTLKWETHPLCQHEAVLVDPAKLVSIKEGCNLDGHLEVNKVAGNFHLAPGKAFQTPQGQLVHEFKPFDTHFYNVSHVIHHLSFGVHYPGQINPLDDSQSILSTGSGVFQYFIKVVPTSYKFVSGKSLSSCQYSVTDQFKSAHDPSKGFVLPGVFFIYDISPIMVQFTEKRKTFTYFLTSLCAIVGGVFTVAGIVDAAIYQLGSSGSGAQLG